jgi:starch synthase
MYAQRFGALPIGHRTGGLAETIEAGRTGFLFDRLDIAAFDDAIDDAFAVFEAPLELQAMRRAAMAKDFSWAEPALAYAALYRKLGVARRVETPAAAPPTFQSAAKSADPASLDDRSIAAAA